MVWKDKSCRENVYPQRGKAERKLNSVATETGPFRLKVVEGFESLIKDTEVY